MLQFRTVTVNQVVAPTMSISNLPRNKFVLPRTNGRSYSHPNISVHTSVFYCQEENVRSSSSNSIRRTKSLLKSKVRELRKSNTAESKVTVLRPSMTANETDKHLFWAYLTFVQLHSVRFQAET